MREFTYSSKKAPDGTGFNDAPKGWREITASEYADSMGFTYEPVMVEHRQMLIPGENYALSGNLHWFHDGTGTCIVRDQVKKTFGYGYESVLRFFVFGCDHDYRAMTGEEIKANKCMVGNCVHHYVCTKCGHIDVQDSSD